MVNSVGGYFLGCEDLGDVDLGDLGEDFLEDTNL